MSVISTPQYMTNIIQNSQNNKSSKNVAKLKHISIRATNGTSEDEVPGMSCAVHFTIFVSSTLLSKYTPTLPSTVVTICTTMFNIQQFYVLPTQCIYVFCVDLRTNSDYFTVQH
jgi:hypothetical protein